MKIPFTGGQFFEFFARYTESVWPIQILFNTLALAVVVLLFKRKINFCTLPDFPLPHPHGDRLG